MISLWIFWIALAALVYAYVLFPALVVLRGVFCRRALRSADIEPSVTLLIAAHNEAACIGDKIENSLALDYPRNRLQIIIASDGSTDGTNEIAASYERQGVTLLSLPRRGKDATLNAAHPFDRPTNGGLKRALLGQTK